MKIMVVDDSKTARMFVTKVINMVMDNDVEIVEVDSGEVAFASLYEKDVNVDLIFCDVNMPVMSGYTFMHNITMEPSTSDIPVVFVTSVSNAGNIKHLKELGAKGVIPKPVKTDDIVTVLEHFGFLKDQKDAWGA